MMQCSIHFLHIFSLLKLKLTLSLINPHGINKLRYIKLINYEIRLYYIISLTPVRQDFMLIVN